MGDDKKHDIDNGQKGDFDRPTANTGASSIPEAENAVHPTDRDAMMNKSRDEPDTYSTVSGNRTGAATAKASMGTIGPLGGLFRDRESAENAYRSLAERGYSRDDVNVIMTDETRKKYFSDVDTDLGSKALEGMAVGGAVGGTVGALLAAIAAIGTQVVLPGLGLVVAGPLAAALAGAGAGSVTGGLVGSLVGAGIPEERAKFYDEGVRNGGIYMGVNPRSDDDASYLENEWRDTHRAQHVYR